MRLSAISGFNGIDQRAEFSNKLGTASDMMNFRVTDSGSLVRREGISWLWNAPKKIDGIWSGNLGGTETVLVVSDCRIYKLTPNTIPATAMALGTVGEGKCVMFEFGGLLYIKTATSYHKYDGMVFSEVEGYMPLVALSCSPDGKGEIFEQINLICEKRRQLFSGDGSGLLYVLAENDIAEILSVKIDGKDCEIDYYVIKDKGQISFKTAPPEGINNVEIIYRKDNDADFMERIFGCSKIMRFGGNSDGRIFLWGNDKYPNYRFHSDLANGIPSAEYFPVNGFTIIGNNRINCIVQQYDKQLIFTENQAYYSYCELKTDTLGNTYSSFPVFSLNNSKGCIFETDGCVIDNRPVTLCADGLNLWESTSVINEKNAVCFSAPIHNSMRVILDGDKSKMKLFDFQGNREMYFIYDRVAYIYNYGNGTWYSYDDFAVDCFSTNGKLLYFSRGDVMYLFGNDNLCDLERVAYWESSYIHGGHNTGNCDLVKFEADVHICGPDRIMLEFAKSGTDVLCTRELYFPDIADKFTRISLRPVLKRAMPFKIIFTDNGPGKCILHGFSIKTRNRERSCRDGIL